MPIGTETKQKFQAAQDKGFTSPQVGNWDWPYKAPHLVTDMQDIAAMLKKMISWAGADEAPKSMVYNLELILKRFFAVSERMTGLTISANQGIEPIFNSAKVEVEGFVDRALRPNHRSNDSEDEKLLLPTFSVLSEFARQPIHVLSETESEAIKAAIALAGQAKVIIPPIIEGVQRAGAPVAYKEYAQVFFQEARRHSRRIFTKYKGNIPDENEERSWISDKFDSIGGSAERWFLGSILLLASGVLLVFASLGTKFFTTGWVYDTMTRKYSTTIAFDWTVLPIIAAKTLGILVLIFLLRFSAKQYSIHKHIAVTNRHRANALNSFALLFSTVGTEVPDVREQLTVLVATAVYQSFETGFLSDKTTEIGILPLEQLTKLPKGGGG